MSLAKMEGRPAEPLPITCFTSQTRIGLTEAKVVARGPLTFTALKQACVAKNVVVQRGHATIDFLSSTHAC
jgi:hypothetical protein